MVMVAFAFRHNRNFDFPDDFYRDVLDDFVWDCHLLVDRDRVWDWVVFVNWYIHWYAYWYRLGNYDG